MLRKITAVLLFYIFLSGVSFGQQITANDTLGCAPMVGVQFTGISGATNILWNFQDGSTANVNNPTHTFTSSGTYVVTYSATVSGSPVNQSITIYVFGKPTPSFSASTPVSGCVPLAVGFTSNSTGGGGTQIVNYVWAFGDGGGSTGAAAPSYTYTIPGQYSVTLIVTDENGCDSSTTISNYVTVSNPPSPVISSTPNPASSCFPPLNVTFSGTSSVSGSPTGSTLTYQWNFGNGNTSTSATPTVQTYSTAGTYNVTLTVTDNNNCSNTATTNVSIANPFATFFVPDTVCKSVTFNSTGSSPGILLWNYGDGQTGISPSHTYASSGTYTVTLTVFSGSCVDDTTVVIFVEDVVADFSSSPTYSCTMPQTVTFNNTSVNGDTYQWSFTSGSPSFYFDQDTSTAINPTVIINESDTNQYTIWEELFLLNATLTVTTEHGCTATITQTLLDTVFLPSAWFQPDIYQGCVPLAITFSDSSQSNEDIVNWHYDYGDGNTTTGAVGDVSHTYNSPGVYFASLVITNSAGCIDTSFLVRIEVGAMPTPDFTISPNSVCSGESVDFTDASTSNGSPIDTWHYYTDNGFMMSSCFNDPNPTWSFASATGVQDITLEACSNGCCASVTVPSAITVLGPRAEFTTKQECTTPFDVTFTGLLQDADNWTWDFGDGVVMTNSTQNIVTHTYAATGDYTATLIAYNGSSGCDPDTFQVPVYIKDINAIILSDTMACIQVGESFNATPSQDVYTYGNNGYIWLWGDNTPPTITSSPISSHAFTSQGNYTVTLVVTDRNGCRDTTTQNLRVSRVNANFTTDAVNGCIPWPVFFDDLSNSDTTIVGWSWQFGDGQFGTGDTITHTYTDNFTASFFATLTVTNILGCTGSFTQALTPSKPISTFFANDNTVCAGTTISFFPTANYHTDYLWNFGNNNDTSTDLNASYTYPSGGTYTVSLTVTDSIGCTQTSTFNNYINVQDIPQAGFVSAADTSNNLCYPYAIVVQDTSIANIFFSRQWDLGNGSSIVPSSQVTTIYQTPGTYTVTLIVTTTFGCKDTVSKDYTIVGPQGSFTISDPIICKGDSVVFTLVNPVDVTSYNWDFGDGSDTSNVSPVSHTFNFHPPSGTNYVSLVLYSGNQACPVAITLPFDIHPVISDFDRNGPTDTDTSQCLGETTSLFNVSTNASTWAWNFGDGATSTQLDPTHIYASSGTYYVSLAIEHSVTGCKDTMEKAIVIYDSPTAVSFDTSACEGVPTLLTASGAGTGGTYEWSPATGLSSTTVPNPLASPTSTTTYTVVITDQNGCMDSTTSTVEIIVEPPSVISNDTIVIGQSIQLVYPYPQSYYIYSWSPTDSLSCVDCPNPFADPQQNTMYTLTITDPNGCFVSQSNFYVEVLPLSSVDVPTAFTPNGDGVNDVVYVGGWGIKKLIEFNIYDRWGELIFTSDDINVGWDGFYKGALQNMDSYAYTVKAETFIDAEPQTLQGFIKLIR